MSEENQEELPDEEKQKKPSLLKSAAFTVAGAVAMGGLAAGAAYFFTPGEAGCAAEAVGEEGESIRHAALENVTFVNLEPLVVTLGPQARSRYLKISLSLETTKDDQDRLYKLSPRIRDTLNTYLRAVEEEELVRPSGMTRLRAQMLRRLRLAAPGAKISDILITDFVLN